MSVYFVYGSLSNPVTLGFEGRLEMARLDGWQRSWHHSVVTDVGPVCAVTIHELNGRSVPGFLLTAETEVLAILREREVGYVPRRVAVVVEEDQRAETATAFVSTPECFRKGSRSFPIWQSYLDAVLTGYWDHGGEAAVRRFIRSSDHWDVPILSDRDQPLYARHVTMRSDLFPTLDALLEAEAPQLEYLLELDG